MYRIAFTGLGSIAKRHVKNVAAYLQQQGVEFSIDLYRSTLGRNLPEDIAPLISGQYLFSDPLTADQLYDAVFVTNPTSMHYETLLKFRYHAKAFFIEKPVFDCSREDIALFCNVYSYVACPLRYNPVLQYVKKNVNIKDVISVRAISSSYLPDWRPGQDYRTTYSAHADMGGGVDIDLIHEWDYLSWLFGMPTKCYGIAGTYSDLEIDSNDIAIYIAKNERVTFELHLDYFGRKTKRTLEIFTKEDTIVCDILSGNIRYLKSGQEHSFNCERNSFQLEEMKHFFDIVYGRTINDSDIQHANDILRLTKIYE